MWLPIPKSWCHILTGPDSAPSNVEAELLCPDAAIVTWNYPDASESGVAGYKIYYSTSPFDVQNITVDANKPYALVKGLNPDATYNFTVSAFTEDGEGPESDAATVETEEEKDDDDDDDDDDYELVGKIIIYLGITILVVILTFQSGPNINITYKHTTSQFWMQKETGYPEEPCKSAHV